MLTSELITEPNPNPDQMDKEGAAEEDHTKMEIASVESTTATEKRKRGGNPKALTKQKCTRSQTRNDISTMAGAKLSQG